MTTIKSVMNQILNYPTPISDGDSQFDFLLSERDRLREEEDDNNDDNDKRKQREKSTEREEKEKEAVERIATTEYTYGYDLSKETYLERMKRAKEENTKTSSSDYPPYVIEPFHITTTTKDDGDDDDDEKD